MSDGRVRLNHDDRTIRLLVTQHLIFTFTTVKNSLSKQFDVVVSTVESLYCTTGRVAQLLCDLKLHTVGYLLNIVFHAFDLLVVNQSCSA